MAAKFTASEKHLYATLKMHYPDVTFDIDTDLGVTIARMDHGSDFYRVSIAYCGRFDEFSKKRGKFEALVKMDSNQFIILPKAKNYKSRDQLTFILETI